MPKPADQSCGNCKFAVLVGSQWLCKANPPHPVVDQTGIHYVFVPVSVDEWCGEWVKQ